MPALELLLPFIVATVLISFTPGPGMLYAAAQTIGHGSRYGFYTALGLHIGSYFHILAAAFGLSLLLATVPTVYTVIKFVGAAYLVWLGIRFFISDLPAPTPHDVGRSSTRTKAVRESVLVEVFNPKSALFFVAFLPQFTDTSASFPLWLQIVVLGTLVNFTFSITDIACVLLSDRAARLLSTSQKTMRWFRRLAGTILVALGINIGLSEVT